MKPEFFALYRMSSNTISLAKVASFLSTLGLQFAPRWSAAAYYYDGLERIVEHRPEPAWCTLDELQHRLDNRDFGYQTAVVAPYLPNAPLNFGVIELQGLAHVAVEIGHESLVRCHQQLSAHGSGSEALLLGLHRALNAAGSVLGWELTVDTLAAILAGTIDTSSFEELANGSEIRLLLSENAALTAALLRDEVYRRVSVADLQPIVSWFPDFPR